jgi:hypothetical protein
VRDYTPILPRAGPAQASPLWGFLLDHPILSFPGAEDPIAFGGKADISQRLPNNRDLRVPLSQRQIEGLAQVKNPAEPAVKREAEEEWGQKGTAIADPHSLSSSDVLDEVLAVIVPPIDPVGEMRSGLHDEIVS